MSYVNDHDGFCGRETNRCSEENSNALGNALEMMVTSLSHMQKAMKAMELKMVRTDASVQIIMQRLNTVEDKLETMAQEFDFSVDREESSPKLKNKPKSWGDSKLETSPTEKRDSGSQFNCMSQQTTMCQEGLQCRNFVSATSSDNDITPPLVEESPSGIPCVPPTTPDSEVTSKSSSHCSICLFASSLASHPSSIRRNPASSVPSRFTIFANPPEPRKQSRIKTRGTHSSTVKSISDTRKHVLLGRRLLKAAQEGRTKDIKSLLHQGADANFTNKLKCTPLHKAVMHGQTDVVTLLLEQGVNLNARNCCGFTALHFAARNDPSGLCSCFLIYAGCNVNSRNQCGRTALHYAAEFENLGTIQALLMAGASQNVRDRDGKTPYDLAASDNVRQLLSPEFGKEQNGERVHACPWKI